MSLSLKAQTYIGLQKEDILQRMQREHPEFLWQDKVVNPHYNYLKFVDAMERRTWLYFLDEEERCNMVKMMNDYAYLRSTLRWLNDTFSKEENGKWVGSTNDHPLDLRLSREEWFFTVWIRKLND